MNLIKVHIVGAEPAKAVVNRVMDVLARQTPLVWVVAHGAEHLRRDDNFIAPRGKLLDGPTRDLFADAQGIDIGCVEEVDAHFDTRA